MLANTLRLVRPILHTPAASAQGDAPAILHNRAVAVLQDRIMLSGAIRFGAVNINPEQLFERFKLKPDQVEVVYGMNQDGASSVIGQITAEEKRDLLGHYLESNRLVQEYRLEGNIKGDYWATCTQMSDGTWGSGVNMMLSPSLVQCSERASVNDAFTNYLEKQNRSQAPVGSIPPQKPVTVKNLVLSTPKLGEPLTPCSDCMAWMDTDQFFTPDTRLIHLIQDQATGQYKLWVRTLRDFLPYWGKKQPSLTTLPLNSLPIDRTMSAKGLSDQKVKALLKWAQKDFNDSKPGKFTPQQLSAAILLSDGTVSADSRFEWHKRLVETAELNAAGRGFRPRSTWAKVLLTPLTFVARLLQSGKETEPTLSAIAYYGNAAQDIPDIKSLGYLAKKQHGSPNTLLILIENNRIKVRTISDYLPELYISKTDQAQPRTL